MRFWATLICTLILDQISKLWLSSQMALGQSIALIPGILDLTYVRNRGAAFGILQGQTWFFLLMAVAITAGLIYFNLKYTPPPWVQFASGLICAGSVGNMIDRSFYGGVRDFFSIGWWPVFNVADMAVVAGGSILILFLLRNDSWPQAR